MATIITTFTIKKVVELWQPSSLVEVKPALGAILDTLHHPFNYSKESEVQSLMVAEVLDWCTSKAQESPQEYRGILKRLDRSHMTARLGEAAGHTAHSHAAASAASHQPLSNGHGTNVHNREQTGHPDVLASTAAHESPNRVGATEVDNPETTTGSNAPAYTAAYAMPGRVGGTTVHDLVTIGPIDVAASSDEQTNSDEGTRRKGRASFNERISSNIEKLLKSGAVEGMTMGDLARIKKVMEAPPSSDAPSPIDESLTLLPGKNLLVCFEGIDIGEIVAAPGMGIVLKDSMIAMRLRDTKMVEREQLAAREKLGALEDRPIKEMLAMLDFGAKKVEQIEMEQKNRPTEPSRMKRLMNKLKIEDR